ncbi:hypothetical protein K3U93_21530 [Mycobacterium malmoense]|uniref:hypothetical protein n=1 Tax=Mycobacterium malmoense TaxID=1780 RepID=UPI00111BE98B|nr:hypothetical protein [Mycobacterium malmoense]QZA17148.1 hypothetical protein K3U93_21530 [Mycobacterium malmoense]UNB93939.1 hypothetical protein H5T25_21505 [Mycobacterium malmoense]
MDDAMKSAPDRADYLDIRDFIRDWENYWNHVKPSASALLARSARLANDAAVAIDIQIERIHDEFHSRDPDVISLISTALIDIEFLISSLWKMRLAGKLAQSAMGRSWTALGEFDAAIPHLKLMRDVMQHIDEYGQDGDGRRHLSPRTGRRIGRRLLHSQMGFGDNSFNWLGGTLDFDQARNASLLLLSAIRAARDNQAAT